MALETPPPAPADGPPPGWQRAGYTGPGCERYGAPGAVEHADEAAPGGWQRAGYTDEALEQFATAGA